LNLLLYNSLAFCLLSPKLPGQGWRNSHQPIRW